MPRRHGHAWRCVHTSPHAVYVLCHPRSRRRRDEKAITIRPARGLADMSADFRPFKLKPAGLAPSRVRRFVGRDVPLAMRAPCTHHSNAVICCRDDGHKRYCGIAQRVHDTRSTEHPPIGCRPAASRLPGRLGGLVFKSRPVFPLSGIRDLFPAFPASTVLSPTTRLLRASATRFCFPAKPTPWARSKRMSTPHPRRWRRLRAVARTHDPAVLRGQRTGRFELSKP